MFEPSSLKRAIDIAFALPVAVVAFPVCAVLMLAIRLESPGSPLLVQDRIGRNCRPFRMFKLRTMYRDTPNVASHEVGHSRITRLGTVLRKLKLDELPQLLNVLEGTMSLVGPRPCLPNQHELIAEREKRGLFRLRPGITGPAQLLGIDMSTPQRLAEVEAEYFENSTPLAEVALIARTFLGRGHGDAARLGG